MTTVQKLDDDVEVAIRRMIKQRVSVDEVGLLCDCDNLAFAFPISSQLGAGALRAESVDGRRHF